MRLGGARETGALRIFNGVALWNGGPAGPAVAALATAGGRAYSRRIAK